MYILEIIGGEYEQHFYFADVYVSKEGAMKEFNELASQADSLDLENLTIYSAIVADNGKIVASDEIVAAMSF